MEKDSPSKPSVAELAGRFKGHILPMPAANDELFRRRLPCSLKLQNPKDDNEESDKTVVSPNPFKIKMRNSSVIEKLQANLALSPTSLLPSPKSPEVKLQPAPRPPHPTPPGSPLSPTPRPSHQSSEEEDPSGFDSPPEGAPLLSFNKTRARLSFKRRPPTRQHRRSAGEEAGALGSGPAPCELNSPKENGDGEQVFHSPAEEDECGLPGSLEDAEDKDMDCDKTENKGARSDPDSEGEPEEEQAQSLEEEPQPSGLSPAEQTEGGVEEEKPHREGNDKL